MDDTRLKRLAMRSKRRGIKEMDLILGAFADGAMAGLPGPDLDLYEALLAENDHDLYQWVTARLGTGAMPRGPQAYAALLDQIAEAARHLVR